MKIGILTYHRACNYGAYLQACCLCGRLNMEPDMEAEIIDFHMEKEENQYDYRKRNIVKRILKYPVYQFKYILNDTVTGAQKEIPKKSEAYLKSDSMEAFTDFVRDKYDVIIAGSDEIWKLDGFRGFPTPYWLVGDLGCKKFSYAASSRSDIDCVSEEQRQQVGALLKDFDFISVRDEMTYDMVAKVLGDSSNLSINCDPSFLYDFPVQYNPIEEKMAGFKAWDRNKKNIVVMLDSNKAAQGIYQKLKRDYNLISVCSYHKGYFNIPNLTPFEWLALISHSDLVITSYFHGVCFSMMKQIPFIATAEAKKVSKLNGLLKGTKLEHRYIVDGDYLCKEALSIVKKEMEREDYSDYIEEKRKNFPDYLNKLREVCE